MVAVGAHKADRVGRARQEIRTPGLERRQIAGFDLQRRRDIVEIEAERLSLLTQQIPGGSRTEREAASPSGRSSMKGVLRRRNNAML